jgi:hypothetical protein
MDEGYSQDVFDLKSVCSASIERNLSGRDEK